MKYLFNVLVLLVLTACTTVRYNGTNVFIKEVDYPEVGTVITVSVGEHMIEKGTITEESILLVHKTIDGGFYDIPAKKYAQVGFDTSQDFYEASGVVRAGLADPVRALALKKQEGAELCVVSVYGGTYCYSGEYERKKQLSERGNSFQQTLIYSGRVGNKINVGYREFSNNTARPAFNNDVEYDMSSSNTIGYKGALIEVLSADNSSITYKLIRSFP